MSLKRAALLMAPALLTASALVNPAGAADVAPPPPSGEWRFTIAPYVWAAGIDGDVGLFGREPVSIDVPFSDVLENLDVAAMGVAEAHNGTWGVLVDLNYVNLGAKRSLSRAISEQPPVTADLRASVDVEEFIGTLMGQWRALDSETVSLDLMGGVRYWHVDNEVTLRLKANGQEVKSLSGSDGASWIDPMLGAKARIDTDTPVYFTGWGMVGGFGAGSELSWDVMGGVGYQWTENFSTVLGYRAIGVDYRDDGFTYDVIQSGAVLGGVFNF